MQNLLHERSNNVASIDYTLHDDGETDVKTIGSNGTFRTLAGLQVPENVSSVPAFTRELQKAKEFEERVHQKLLYDEE